MYFFVFFSIVNSNYAKDDSKCESQKIITKFHVLGKNVVFELIYISVIRLRILKESMLMKNYNFANSQTVKRHDL